MRRQRAARTAADYLPEGVELALGLFVGLLAGGDLTLQFGLALLQERTLGLGAVEGLAQLSLQERESMALAAEVWPAYQVGHP